VREIAFDPHLARVMLNNLLEDGCPAVEMRQGWVTMAPAVKELKRAIIGRCFRHGGHPVLRWCFDNIAVETDKATFARSPNGCCRPVSGFRRTLATSPHESGNQCSPKLSLINHAHA
jgi:hypothetical protein